MQIPGKRGFDGFEGRVCFQRETLPIDEMALQMDDLVNLKSRSLAQFFTSPDPKLLFSTRAETKVLPVIAIGRSNRVVLRVDLPFMSLVVLRVECLVKAKQIHG